MNFKKFSLVALFLLILILFVPKISLAVDVNDIQPPKVSIIVRIQEGIKYFFTFKIENKVNVLEENADKRLTWAKNYAESGNDQGVQGMIQSYLQIKEKQDGLLGKVDGQVLGTVAENTIEQQKVMEEIKVKTSDEVDNWIIDVQEGVVNQVAERIVVTNGAEGQTEFFNKVEHVWAPGTEPKDGKPSASGVVIEGGTMQFAPGTSGGGPATSDIKTREVKTGGVSNDVPVNGGLAPVTTENKPVNTIDPGGVNTSGMEGTTNIIDP